MSAQPELERSMCCASELCTPADLPLGRVHFFSLPFFQLSIPSLSWQPLYSLCLVGFHRHHRRFWCLNRRLLQCPRPHPHLCSHHHPCPPPPRRRHHLLICLTCLLGFCFFAGFSTTSSFFVEQSHPQLQHNSLNQGKHTSCKMQRELGVCTSPHRSTCLDLLC